MISVVGLQVGDEKLVSASAEDQLSINRIRRRDLEHVDPGNDKLLRIQVHVNCAILCNKYGHSL